MTARQRSVDVWISILSIFVLVWVYLSGLEDIPFHPDESYWINSSNVFEDFISARFDSPLFQDQFLTVDHPPLTRYVIGLGRRSGGYRGSDLPPVWDYLADEEVNIRNGAMPSGDLLWWSRLPMAILAIVSVLVTYDLIRRSAGNSAGYVLLLGSIVSSYMLCILRRAMGESLLLVCTVLVTYCSYRILMLLNQKKTIRFWKIPALLVMVGILSGAAGATKLNGLICAPAAVIVALIVGAKSGGSIYRKTLSGFLASILVSVCSVCSFVGLNPFLWSDPVLNTQKLFVHRLNELGNQMLVNEDAQIDGIVQRVRIVPIRVFQTHAAVNFKGSFAINILLFLAGFCKMAKRAWDSIRTGELDAAPTAVIIIGLFAATPALLTPLDWDRYFLLPVYFSMFFICIGISMVAGKAGRLLIKK